MFLVELIASSFVDLISKQARPACRCKRVLVRNPYTTHIIGLFVSEFPEEFGL